VGGKGRGEREDPTLGKTDPPFPARRVKGRSEKKEEGSNLSEELLWIKGGKGKRHRVSFCCDIGNNHELKEGKKPFGKTLKNVLYKKKRRKVVTREGGSGLQII